LSSLKSGRKAFPARGVLRETGQRVLKTKIQGVGIHLVKFFFGERTVESLSILPGDRNVLGHEAQRKSAPNSTKSCVSRIDGVGHISGENEVADRTPFLAKGRPCQNSPENLLREHDGKVAARATSAIVPALGQPFRQIPVRIFEKSGDKCPRIPQPI